MCVEYYCPFHFILYVVILVHSEFYVLKVRLINSSYYCLAFTYSNFTISVDIIFFSI